MIGAAFTPAEEAPDLLALVREALLEDLAQELEPPTSVMEEPCVPL